MTRVETTAGPIEVEQVVVAVGPWIPKLWRMLGLPELIDVRRPDGGVDRERPMWTYWYLQEGEVALPPETLRTDDGRESPVLHVDSDRPLVDDEGRLVSEGPWGIYVKPDRESVQGGAEPLELGGEPEVDPYPTGTVEEGFPDRWCAALSACMQRFRAVGRNTASSARAAPARSRPTTSRSSTGCARTSSSPRTPTTATR